MFSVFNERMRKETSTLWRWMCCCCCFCCLVLRLANNTNKHQTCRLGFCTRRPPLSGVFVLMLRCTMPVHVYMPAQPTHDACVWAMRRVAMKSISVRMRPRRRDLRCCRRRLSVSPTIRPSGQHADTGIGMRHMHAAWDAVQINRILQKCVCVCAAEEAAEQCRRIRYRSRRAFCHFHASTGRRYACSEYSRARSTLFKF